MTRAFCSPLRHASRLLGSAALLLLVLALPAAGKDDVGPKNASCDGIDKRATAWTACLGAAKANLDDAELFYAGYWLARSGAYQEALTYLERAKAPDERILTYQGFATRKLGNIAGAFVYYERALAINPDYVVARAYMGEALLAQGEPDKAKEQLAEIAKRCGVVCTEYTELAKEIASAGAAAHG